MYPASAPSFVSAKLATLSDQRAADAVRNDQITQEVASLRDRWSGKAVRNEHVNYRDEIEARLIEQKLIVARQASLGNIITACRDWLASLPPNASLEMVAPEIPTGQTLPAIRAQIKTLEASVAALRKIPTPASDIEQKVKSYIANLTQPVIRGVGAGEELSMTWPGAPTQFSAIPPSDWFVMCAFLEPDKFAARLLDTINKQAPPSDRDVNIKQLERDIEQLERVEEVLVVSTRATRISGRSVQAVLGCRVSSTSRSARAA